MRIRVFGAFGAIGDDGQELSVGGPKQRTVLALLAVEPGRWVSTDSLTMAVWGDEVPQRALRSLSTYVSNLRRELGDVIDSGSGSYALRVDRSHVDACAFVDALEAASSGDGAERVASRREALSLWTGEPFSGLDGFGAFRDEAQRLGALRLEAERVVVGADIEAGDAASVVSHVDGLVREFPFDEGLRGLHMRALYRSGRQAEALSSFNSFRTRLADELGLDPSSELQDLELKILQHDESLDLTRDEPPTIGRLSGLPKRYSTFVGRDTDVAETRDRLVDHRLVSLIGAGGIGKSSIALEAARSLETDTAVVVHVPIESIGTGDVAMSVARSIGLEPAANVDPVDVIASYVATRPHVMVLDGCEALIIEVAQLADRLLTMTECTLLATSREPLGLNGESTIRVDPLPVDAALQVFRDRAELQDDLDESTLETIRSICVALDGMPLAVELAAARAKTIPIDRLADRMSDQIPLLTRARSFDERHGSLLAALDWSYNLLDDEEQSVLLAVSVFLTRFTIVDATALADRSDTEDCLSRLVDVSLLQPQADRSEYSFLEPVRQYARHKLAESGQSDNVYQRHAEWAATAATRAEDEQFSPKVREVRSWIFNKRHEMLAAVTWALDADQPDLVLRIVASLGHVYKLLGAEQPFLDPTLEAIGHADATLGHDYVIASTRAAWMLRGEGRHVDGLRMLDRALVIAEEAGNLIAQGEVKARKAAMLSGHTGLRPLTLMDEALDLLRVGGRPNYQIHLFNRAFMLMQGGRFEDAAQTAEEYGRWSRRTYGLKMSDYVALLAELSAYGGDLDSALDLFEESATLAESESSYGPALEAWAQAGRMASLVQSPIRFAAAVDHCRRIAQITGQRRTWLVALQMEAAHEDGMFDEVLRLAGDWFNVWQSKAGAVDWSTSTTDEPTIHGSRLQQPGIFEILRPVAGALIATNRRNEACRIVEAVPHLMEQSHFEYWNEFRESELWKPLARECRSQGKYGLEALTLSEAFEFVRELVDNEPTHT
jgi:predicted ATPase/DNA-binding SARP family transcriptional activator